MNKNGFLENLGNELLVQKMTGISVMDTFHIHPQYEIYFCPENIRQRSIINGIEYEYKHAAVILSKPYSVHSMSCMETEDTDFERYIIYFSHDDISHLNSKYLPDSVVEEKNGLLFNITEKEALSLKHILELFVANAEKPLTKSEGELLVTFFINRLFSICDKTRISKVGGTEFYIQDVLRYISENFSVSPNVIDIAQHFSVSRSKLERDFKKIAGKTPHEFIDMCRINQAKRLLASKEDLSVSEISSMCGFSSETYFFPFFHKHVGMSPTEYRKETRSKNNKKIKVNQIN